MARIDFQQLLPTFACNTCAVKNRAPLYRFYKLKGQILCQDKSDLDVKVSIGPPVTLRSINQHNQ